MRILVTGGTGFVGHWLKETAPKDADVFYLSHREYDKKEWADEHYDYIIHAANISPIDVINNALWYDSKVLYISSGAVYHKVKNDYGENKVLWENMMEMSGVKYCSARLFACCGYKLKWDNFALGTFIKNAAHHEPLRIWGDGSMIRSYIYGSDMGRWFWKILFAGENGEAYDVGSYRAVSIYELAREILGRIDTSSKIVIENSNYYERVPVYLPKDIEKTENLGLGLKIGFEAAIVNSIKDYYNEILMPGMCVAI